MLAAGVGGCDFVTEPRSSVTSAHPGATPRMCTLDSREKCPQDLVAIFHASFHPTEGNVIDWSLKASADLNLDQVEFSALPSGLHLVEQDVVYFTKDDQQGVCIFRRRKTTEHGHRGFRLSSLGILLAKSRRPRAWKHVKALKELTNTIYSQLEDTEVLEPRDGDWEPAHIFFEERKLKRADLGGAGDWAGWGEELNGAYAEPIESNPTVHLPHLLSILGPSSLTLYKHILGRKRVLIYTLPPVEVACILCQVAADICFDSQIDSDDHEVPKGRLKGRHRDPVNVLGMVTLTDLDRLRLASQSGRGWVACTTDAIFMEKPSYYDLIIDLTTSTPKATRPTFYSSKPILSSQAGSSRGPTHRLSTIRFAWSDVKLWNEIDRILLLDSGSYASCCCATSCGDSNAKYRSITAWTDAWQVYEDVCIICAGLWMGYWRGNSQTSYSTANGPENWGSVRLEGDDDLTLDGTYVRNVGMGIEGRPNIGGSTLTVPATAPRNVRRSSAISWSSGKTSTAGTLPPSNGKIQQTPSSSSSPIGPIHITASSNDETYTLNNYTDLEEVVRSRNGQVMTTLAILQTFHAHISFQLSVLENLLARQKPSSSAAGEVVVHLMPKDILAFELGPFSGFDARYLEWLTDEYVNSGVKVVVKRGWKDLLSAIFGYS